MPQRVHDECMSLSLRHHDQRCRYQKVFVIFYYFCRGTAYMCHNGKIASFAPGSHDLGGTHVLGRGRCDVMGMARTAGKKVGRV